MRCSVTRKTIEVQPVMGVTLHRLQNIRRRILCQPLRLSWLAHNIENGGTLYSSRVHIFSQYVLCFFGSFTYPGVHLDLLKIHFYIHAAQGHKLFFLAYQLNLKPQRRKF